ncbi:hypothetical protein DCO46_10805 [Flavobacterium sp. HTF]|nr:hypothetical protein DCO46_10805 [Flavobacterium sp. HTF]
MNIKKSINIFFIFVKLRLEVINSLKLANNTDSYKAIIYSYLKNNDKFTKQQITKSLWTLFPGIC